MSSLARFVRTGLDDAAQRIERRLPPDVTDHPWVCDAIGAGVVSGWITRLVGIGRAACESSMALAALRQVQTSWHGAHWSSRRRTTGLLLLTAVGVHAALVVWVGRPAGWIWMVVPGLMAGLAVLLLVASVAPSRPVQE